MFLGCPRGRPHAESPVEIGERLSALADERFVEIRGLEALPESAHGLVGRHEELDDPERRSGAGQRFQQTGSLVTASVGALEDQGLSTIDEHSGEEMRSVVRVHAVVTISIGFREQELEQGVDLQVDPTVT
nr:hypothetical protein [Catellatospora paridis]